MRYFLEIAYRGTHYFGWQSQKEGKTVQGEMERALSTILKTPTFVNGCGRTDSGVHARQFFLHFDTETVIEDFPYFLISLNGVLAHDVAVYQIIKVDEKANSRFDAISRTYRYYYTLQKDPFLQELAVRLYKKPDMELMNTVSKMLVGKHDFKSFSRISDVKHHECDVAEAFWEQKEQILVFTIKANRFLRNMVRAITGTLLAVGYGKMTPEEFEKILKGKDRSKAGASAPAHGLYLENVSYPETIWQL